MPRVGLVLAALVMAQCAGPEAETGPSPGRPEPVPSRSSSPKPKESAPRWETVETLSGTGDSETPAFRILNDAIQWRVRYTCSDGTLQIRSTPPSNKDGDPLVEAQCPAQAESYSITTGQARLSIKATGGWTAIVDQQISTPLQEPIPKDVNSPPVAEGEFYNLEKEGKGKAKLYALPDGRRILRLEDFEVTNNTDLFVWLSEALHPKNSADSVAAPRVELGNLRSTLGNQNYEVPAEVAADKIRSVIIWCQPVSVAYSAASLTKPASS